MVETEAITQRFHLLTGMLDERTRRLVAAAEALSIGRGGSVAVARATGISRRAIQQGIKELQGEAGPGAGRVRREGGGRKKTVIIDPSLRGDLERLMVPVCPGDMESPLRWTCKSVRQLTEELKQMGHKTSHRMVAELLHELGYNLQVNRKIKEDRSDWDAQIAYINSAAQAYFAAGDPVISVEARKKEFVGEFRHGERELSPQGSLEKVWVYDFLISEPGRVMLYDVYNLGHDPGYVNTGVDHGTGAFAAESIQHWWNATGHVAYTHARRLLITTNGSDMFRMRLWNLKIQKLADETGLAITVCHLPPGTSKWNKIEYQFFAFISQNWQDQPLINYEVIIKLIAAPVTLAGLKVQRHLDTGTYPPGHSGLDAEMASILLVRDAFHGEWNYTILPHYVSQ